MFADFYNRIQIKVPCNSWLFLKTMIGHDFVFSSEISVLFLWWSVNYYHVLLEYIMDDHLVPSSHKDSNAYMVSSRMTVVLDKYSGWCRHALATNKWLAMKYGHGGQFQWQMHKIFFMQINVCRPKKVHKLSDFRKGSLCGKKSINFVPVKVSVMFCNLRGSK